MATGGMYTRVEGCTHALQRLEAERPYHVRRVAEHLRVYQGQRQEARHKAGAVGKGHSLFSAQAHRLEARPP